MKRIASFFLAIVLALPLLLGCSAANQEAESAADTLYELGLFQGKGTGADGRPDYALDDVPTRQEAVTMLVRLLGKESEAKSGSWTIPFTDVTAWAAPYVGYAYANGLTTGVSASAFDGSSAVTAAQYITFVLRALGYRSGTDFQWNTAWELSDSLGITDGRYRAGAAQFLRADVALISAAALEAKLAGSDTTLREKILSSAAEPARPETKPDSNPQLVHPVRDGDGRYSWRFAFQLKNSGSTALTLQKLTICKRQGGANGKLIDQVSLTGDALAENFLGDADGPLKLAPDEFYLWRDGHPVVNDFDFMGYTFTFADEDGKTTELFFPKPLSREPEEGGSAGISEQGRDLETLRYDASFCTEVAQGVYWVPARALGGSDYTNAEIRAMLTDTPEEKQEKIDTLYEALQLYQIGEFAEGDDNIRIREGSINWEHHKPGYHAVRTNRGCCATDANWLRYLLDGDYDEVGYLATSQRDGSGHIINYIRQDGWYYFIDLTHYRTDNLDTAVENGDLAGYYRTDFISGNIHKVRDTADYVAYVQSSFNEPPGLMFLYTAENCLALDGVRSGSKVTITYEKADGVTLQAIFDDPADQLDWTLVTRSKKLPDWSKEQSFDFRTLQ